MQKSKGSGGDEYSDGFFWEFLLIFHCILSFIFSRNHISDYGSIAVKKQELQDLTENRERPEDRTVSSEMAF